MRCAQSARLVGADRMGALAWWGGNGSEREHGCSPTVTPVALLASGMCGKVRCILSNTPVASITGRDRFVCWLRQIDPTAPLACW